MVVRCPVDNTPMISKIGICPVVHLKNVDLKKNTTKNKRKQRNYFECPNCKRQYVPSICFVQIDVKTCSVIDCVYK